MTLNFDPSTFNPWEVDSIQAFYFLNCPECIFSTKDEYCFQEHALQTHPLSFTLFGKYEKDFEEADNVDKSVDNNVDNSYYEDDNHEDNYPEILQPEASMKIGTDIKGTHIKQEVPEQTPNDPNLDGNELDSGLLPLPYKFDVEPKKEEIVLGK